MTHDEIKRDLLAAVAEVISHRANDRVRRERNITHSHPDFKTHKEVAAQEEIANFRFFFDRWLTDNDK